MEAGFRSWWQKIKQHLITILIVAIILVVAIALIIVGYRFDWTGFNGSNKSGKTLWDWLNLLGVLAIPVVVGLGTLWFTTKQSQASDRANKQQHETELQIATDNQREAALQAYIDKMADLLEKHLRESKPEEEVRKIANIRTLTILPRLDGRRKGFVVQFLLDSGLISINKDVDREKAYELNDLSIISLFGADLSGADLNGPYRLNDVNLAGAILNDAHLEKTDLSGAHLHYAELNGAHLEKADLTKAYLVDAKLKGVRLERARLLNAHLAAADLSGAFLISAVMDQVDLTGAKLIGADLSRARLMSAVMDQVNLTDAKLMRANLSHAKFVSRSGVPIRAKMGSANLTRADLTGAILSGAHLMLVHLTGARLSDANLSDAKLIRANLSDANLRGANLRKADLRGTNLSGADLREADLSEANLTEATVTAEQLDKTKLLQGATMPDGSKHP